MKRFSLCLLLLAALLAPVSAPAVEWDPEQVESLAVELVELTGRVLALAPRQLGQETVIQQRQRDAAVRQMERTHELARTYLDRLRGDPEPEATEPFFFQLREAVRAVRQVARDAVPSKQIEPLLRSIRMVTERIAVYYEPEA